MTQPSENNSRWNLVYAGVIAFLLHQILFYYLLTEHFK